MNLDDIRYKLLHGVPPLSHEECLELWYRATGEQVRQRRRCKVCNATGKVMRAETCPACHGSGYVENYVDGDAFVHTVHVDAQASG